MRPQMHMEELRHLLASHRPLLIELLAATVDLVPAGDVPTAHLDTIITEILFRGEDKDRALRPYDTIQVATDRPDYTLADIGQTRPKVIKQIPTALRTPHSKVGPMSSPLATDTSLPSKEIPPPPV